MVSELVDVDSGRAAEPRSMGRYCVLGRLGSGGMGIVLRAYDPRLRREVALKCLRAAALGEETKARMIREARAMAKIAAPNVVGLYDVEILDDDVVLVMEYVPGQTLRAWLQQSPPWREVLRVFLQAGRGLAAAHRAGLLHRDFSPGNVLLRPDGRALVADFGVAWLGESDRTGHVPRPGVEPPSSDELTRLTADGRVVGTPLYMAPEQCDPEARLDARADQYSFCVALWQAIDGRAPFDVQGRSLDDLLAQKHKGPPRWAGRTRVPSGIVRALRRGLAPRAVDRHPTMDALLATLERHLHRRRRLMVTFGATAALAAATVTYATQRNAHASACVGGQQRVERIWNDDARDGLLATFDEARHPFAGSARERVEARFDTYAADWAAMHTEACEASAVRGEQSERVLDLRMLCLDRAHQRFEAAIDVLSSTETDSVAHADDVVDGLLPLHACTDIDGLLAAVPPPSDPRLAEAVHIVERGLAQVEALVRAGAYPEARARLERLWVEREAWGDHAPAMADVRAQRARLARLDGEYGPAATEARAALEVAVQQGSWDTAFRSANELVAATAAAANPHHALAHVDLALALGHRTVEPLRSEVEARRNFAQVLTILDRHAEAESELRTALALVERGELGVRLEMEIRSRLGQTLKDLRRPADAEAEHRRVLAALTDELGPSHPELSIVHGMLASALKQQSKFEDAERSFRLALELAEQGLGPDHPDLAVPLANLAQMLNVTGRPEEAAAMLERAIDLFTAKHGPEHPRVAIAKLWLAFNRMARHRCDDAEGLFREAIDALKRTEGPDSPNVADALLGLGAVHLRRGEFADAKAVFEEAQRINEVTSVPVLEPSWVLRSIAKATWGLGDHAAARALVEGLEPPMGDAELAEPQSCAAPAPI